MSQNVLTQISVVTCVHQGVATPMIPYPRAAIMGSNIICLASPYTVAGCALPPPPFGNGPCVIGTWLTGAMRVNSMMGPVLMKEGVSICTISGTPLQVKFANARVTVQ